MNNQAHDSQVITQYLLGSLSEQEMERLDERSFTDGVFADSLIDAENDLVDSYVQGELTGERLEQFEASYLASTFGRQKVEFAQSLQVFAEKDAGRQAAAASTETSENLSPRRKSSVWLSGFGFLRAPRFAQFGFAAVALALLVIGGWLTFDNMRLRQQLSGEQVNQAIRLQSEEEAQRQLERQRTGTAAAEQELARARAESERLAQEIKKEQKQQRIPEQPQAPNQEQPSSSGGVSIATFVLSPQMRSVEQVPTVSILPKTEYVSMQLNLEPDDHPAYRATLVDLANQQTLWRSGNLRARGKRDGQTISIRFPASLLRTQTYLVRVTGVSPNGAVEMISDYPFKVVNK